MRLIGILGEHLINSILENRKEFNSLKRDVDERLIYHANIYSNMSVHRLSPEGLARVEKMSEDFRTLASKLKSFRRRFIDFGLPKSNRLLEASSALILLSNIGGSTNLDIILDSHTKISGALGIV